MVKKDKKNLTIKDIARLANTSPATVSNALSGERYVKKETKEKILRLVKKYDYVPNVFARSLTKKRTGILAVITPDIKNSFYSEMIWGIEEVSKKKGYVLMLSSTYYNDETEFNDLRLLSKYNLDGFILLGGSSTVDLSDTVVYKKPSILVNRDIDGKERFSQICIDYIGMIQKALEYIRRLGHKKIAYVGWLSDKATISRLKYEGFIGNIGVDKSKDGDLHTYLKKGIILNEYTEAKDIINKNIEDIRTKGITAILAQNDTLALGVLGCLLEHQVKVPKDMSVMGLGNIKASRYSSPPLSTVNIPKKRIGKLAADVLIKHIEKVNRKNETIYLNTSVVERGSIKDITH